jgi:hypothetical protein
MMAGPSITGRSGRLKYDCVASVMNVAIASQRTIGTTGQKGHRRPDNTTRA